MDDDEQSENEDSISNNLDESLATVIEEDESEYVSCFCLSDQIAR